MADNQRPKIAVGGSIAFDLIMDFPGFFKDHILPEKLHVINISFLVGELRKQRGGCAPNIAYTLALLGEAPRVVGAAGRDFSEYEVWLHEQGIDTAGVRVFDRETTASCYITTDQARNQITGFHPGAMKRAGEISFREAMGDNVSMAIVAPDDPDAMLRHAKEIREAGVRLIFDPSFQCTALDGEKLMQGARGAHVLVLNDYEFAVFQEKTSLTREQLLQEIEMIIVTYGEKGSEIFLRDGSSVKVDAAKVSAVVDPTGAGDAWRGGFLAGYQRSLPLETCMRMGSIAAAYCIENYGTQNHAYTFEQFSQRYAENFGESLVAPVRK
ncbi:MAG: carbohydrate kinase family protein [Armatimonadetes bacterium]|nr:carbohydrate kinase family protein [Armatimonadota bacterium]